MAGFRSARGFMGSSERSLTLSEAVDGLRNTSICVTKRSPSASLAASAGAICGRHLAWRSSPRDLVNKQGP